MTVAMWLFVIPALPLLGAAINLLAGPKLGRRGVYAVAICAVAAACAIAVTLVAGPLWHQYAAWRANPSGDLPAVAGSLYTWIQSGTLTVDLGFRLDTLSAVMILVVTFVGTLIHIYSTGYMAHDPRYATFFGYLNLFTGAMLILVLADNLLVMFIGWEGVGLCSYLLIGFWFDKTANADAGRKAFVVNRIGDCAFLLGIFLLFWSTGTIEMQAFRGAEAHAILTQSWLGGERLAFWAGFLLFIGACGKSAQIPLYVWLPDAMAGPTPVSALIHAATMVTAGVYMVARMSFVYASSTTAMAVVAGVGAATALFAAIMAFTQTDLKKVLAYSTISQLGFMFVAVGVGAYAAGIFHLVTHAFFKAGLFLAAGSVMHAMSNSGDIMKMGGLRKKLKRTHASFLIYCLAISGIFPFSGFFSKDEILAGAFATDAQGWWSLYGEALWLVLSVAAIGTAVYMFRLYFLVFAGKSRTDAETAAHIHESPGSMTVPLIILAAFTVVLGFIGLPHLSWLHHIGLPNVLSSWLEPSVAHGVAGETLDGVTVLLMVIALVLGLFGIGVAYALYGRGPSAKVARAVATSAGAKVYQVVANKFYVDELYELIVVRPFRFLARMLFEVMDRFVIDLLFVNGSAFLVDVSGRIVRWVQNGQVQRYLVGVVIGTALVFFFASRPSAKFSYEQATGASVAFHADVSAGAGAAGSEVAWDFDGDGRTDATDPDATWQFVGPGTYPVTLRITGGLFGNTTSVTQDVAVLAQGARR
ncbi:MAG TPA: NADH-quinone oxidoreductase subunit L [Kofleriaceae bacterium]|nr:NADH-quinone oxidoreductase subunit L [Kofleriaceae bacterium]